MIFQDDLLFPHLSVAANIRFGLKGWPRREAERPAGRGRGALRRRAPARPAAGDALGRRAAARRPGPGPGAPAPAPALRRAGLGARPGEPARPDRPAPRRPAGRGDPGALRHPQPGRGDRAGDAAVPARAGARIVDRGAAARRPGAAPRPGAVARLDGRPQRLPARASRATPPTAARPGSGSTTARPWSSRSTTAPPGTPADRRGPGRRRSCWPAGRSRA